MRTRFVISIVLLLVCCIITGCQTNKPIQNEKIEEKTTKFEPSHKEKEKTDQEKPEYKNVTVSYWLGDAGEKTTNYIIASYKNGQKDLLYDRDECILSGFEDYDIMLKLIFAKKEGKWGIYDKAGAKITEHIFDEILNPEMPDGYKVNGLVRVKQNGLWGAIDQNGNMVIKPEFDFIHLTSYEEIEPYIKVEKIGRLERSRFFYL